MLNQNANSYRWYSNFKSFTNLTKIFIKIYKANETLNLNLNKSSNDLKNMNDSIKDLKKENSELKEFKDRFEVSECLFRIISVSSIKPL